MRATYLQYLHVHDPKPKSEWSRKNKYQLIIYWGKRSD